MEDRFCFPIYLRLEPNGLLVWFVVATHCLTLLLLLLLSGFKLAVLPGIAIAISCRHLLAQLSVVQNYRTLLGVSENHWYLLDAEDKRCWVELKCAVLVHNLVLVSIRRFGEGCFLAGFSSHQRPGHWHRIRVFIRYYLGSV